MNCYYISENNEKQNHAGSKARIDVDAIFRKKGMIPYNHEGFCTGINTSKVKRVLSGIDKYRKLVTKRHTLKGNTLYCQYPFDYSVGSLMPHFLDKVYTDCNLVFVVHDLEFVRFQSEKRRVKELEVLRKAKALIVHNRKMRELLELIPELADVKLIELGLFDYLYDGDYSKQSENKLASVDFAGNLAKSEFFKKIPKDMHLGFQFNLYGPGFNDTFDNESNELYYKGSFDPSDLIVNLSGAFGLVWDGDSLSNPSGLLAEYTRYNNPHKTSLYLVSGKPVICWKSAAIYDFITDNNVGFGIDSLLDIEPIISSITFDDYRVMAENTRKIADKLRVGGYLSQAIDSVNSKL